MVLVIMKLIPLVIEVKRMKVIKRGDIHQLIFYPRVFPVNCYLVEEEKELTLIDTALPNSYRAILGFVEKLGKPLTRIVLTHAHGDHIGSLDNLKERVPEARVYISQRDDRLLRGDRSLDPEERSLPIQGGVPKPGAIKTRPDGFLKEGDTLGSLSVISTPGHTPGSLSFLDGRSRAMIVGDALQTRGGVAVAGQKKWLFPFPAWATWSKEEALKSAKKIQDLQPSLLAVGHGRMLPHPERALAKAILELEMSLKRTKGVSHGIEA